MMEILAILAVCYGVLMVLLLPLAVLWAVLEPLLDAFWPRQGLGRWWRR